MKENKILVSLDAPPAPWSQLWDAAQHEWGSPFHATCFVDALKGSGWQGVYGVEVGNEGHLVATATAVIRTKAGQKWANFFAEPSVQTPNHETKKLISAMMDALRAQKVSFAQTSGSMGRWSSDQVNAAKAQSLSLSPTPFGTYDLDLSKNLDEIYKKFHNKHRKKIRLAQEHGAVARDFGPDFSEDDLKKLYSMIKDTFVRGKATPPPEDYFMNLSRAWLKNGFARMFLVYDKENNVVAGVVIPYSKMRGYSWIGGSGEGAKIPFGANDFLQWAIIQSLKNLGVKIFDFGGARPHVEEGSKLDGIQKFKERFGGVFVPNELWQADLSWKGPLLRLTQKILR